jgi:predicted ATP-binding protein involved in virulence
LHSREVAPRLLLLDDIDRGLHPNAQRRLIEQIQALSSQCQIVCSTHSPYVLDTVSADAVRVMRTDGDGRTRVSALTAHRQWNEWRAHLTGGEFWQYAGDDWLEEA